MLRRIALFLCLPFALVADDWAEFRSGPFEIWTAEGGREARELLNHLEQVRYAVGTALGRPEIATSWPVRVVVAKNAAAIAPALARDTYTGSLPPKTMPPQPWVRQLVRQLIEDGAPRMPPDIEAGLAAFCSTLQVEGTRVTMGAPPPVPERTAGWALVHLLQTSEAYSGKIRVLLYNLQQGVDPEAAYRNAFGKSPGEIAKEAAAHLGAGQFGTWPVNSKPINPQRDFRPSYNPPNAAVALADLKLVTRAAGARASYEALLKDSPAIAREGLGLLALAENRPEDAQRELAAAIEAGSAGARAHLELARIEKDPARRRELIAQAIKLKPDWAAPHAFRASIETDPLRKMQALEQAAKLAVRDAGLWQQLAEAYMTLNRFGDAARAWSAAERAATDQQQRDSIRAARLSIEEKRLEWQAAERKREAEEREREMRLLREKAIAEVRAAEERANRGAPPAPPGRKVVPMFEGPAPQGRVRGRITRIECMAPRARFTVEPETGGSITLMATDPAKVVVYGAATDKFECGPLKPPRLAVIEFFPKEDKKTGTSGEVATIEYQKDPAAAQDAPPETPQRRKLPRQ